MLHLTPIGIIGIGIHNETHLSTMIVNVDKKMYKNGGRMIKKEMMEMKMGKFDVAVVYCVMNMMPVDKKRERDDTEKKNKKGIIPTIGASMMMMMMIESWLT